MSTAVKRASFKKSAGDIPAVIVEGVLETAVKRASFRNSASSSGVATPAENEGESASKPQAKHVSFGTDDVGKKVQLPPLESSPSKTDQGATAQTLRTEKIDEGPNSVKLTPIVSDGQSPRSSSSSSVSKDKVINELEGKLAAMEKRLEVLEMSSRPATSDAPRSQQEFQSPSDTQYNGEYGEPETPSPPPESPDPPPDTAALVFAELMATSTNQQTGESKPNTASPDKMANNLGPGGTELSPVELMEMLQREHQRVMAENQMLYGLVRGHATVTVSPSADSLQPSAEEYMPAENEIQFYNDKELLVAVQETPVKRPKTTPNQANRMRSRSSGDRANSPGGRVKSPGPRVGSPGRPSTSGASIASSTVIVTPVKGVDTAYEKQSLIREKKWVANFGAETTISRKTSSLRTNSYRDGSSASGQRRSSPLQERGKGPVLYLAGTAATSGMARELLDEYAKKPKSPLKREFDTSPVRNCRERREQARPKKVSGGERLRKPDDRRNLKSKSTSNSPCKFKTSRKLFDEPVGSIPPQGLDAPISAISEMSELSDMPPAGGGSANKPTTITTSAVAVTALDLVRPVESPTKRGGSTAVSRTSSSCNSPGRTHLSGPYIHAIEDANVIKEHLVHHAYFGDTEKSQADEDKLDQLAEKLKHDSKANDYIHLQHHDVEQDHEKMDSLRFLGDDISVAHVSKAPKMGQTVLVGQQLKDYMKANAKLAIHRGRALVSGCKEFRERPISKVETKLYKRCVVCVVCSVCVVCCVDILFKSIVL